MLPPLWWDLNTANAIKQMPGVSDIYVAHPHSTTFNSTRNFFWKIRLLLRPVSSPMLPCKHPTAVWPVNKPLTRLFTERWSLSCSSNLHVASHHSHTWNLRLTSWPTLLCQPQSDGPIFQTQRLEHLKASIHFLFNHFVKHKIFLFWDISHIHPFLSMPISNILGWASASHSVGKFIDRPKR